MLHVGPDNARWKKLHFFSQPSPATLLLLLLLFDLQLSCLLNLFFRPLRFFWDGMLSLLFLYHLCLEKKHLRCEFKRSHHKLHLQKTCMWALLMGDRLPGKDSCLPFRFSSLTSFSQLPCHLLLAAYVAYFSSLSCREPQDRQNTNTSACVADAKIILWTFNINMNKPTCKKCFYFWPVHSSNNWSDLRWCSGGMWRTLHGLILYSFPFQPLLLFSKVIIHWLLFHWLTKAQKEERTVIVSIHYKGEWTPFNLEFSIRNLLCGLMQLHFFSFFPRDCCCSFDVKIAYALETPVYKGKGISKNKFLRA